MTNYYVLLKLKVCIDEIYNGETGGEEKVVTLFLPHISMVVAILVHKSIIMII